MMLVIHFLCVFLIIITNTDVQGTGGEVINNIIINNINNSLFLLIIHCFAFFSLLTQTRKTLVVNTQLNRLETL
jgi:hypothetical protein